MSDKSRPKGRSTMKWMKSVTLLGLGLLLASLAYGEEQSQRIFVVSSYHKGYLWSQETQRGLVEAMLNYGYLDNIQQADALRKNDYVVSSKAVIKKAWMDTKRKNSFRQIAKTTARIMGLIHEFQPDLVLLGDDNAANYIGNQLLDTPIPVVFWGINGLPLK